MNLNLLLFSFLLYLAVINSCQLTVTPQDIKFLLFTRQNPSNAQSLQINKTDILNDSNFNKDCPIRIIIHGWQANQNAELNVIIRDEYLKKGDFNIIVVDWSCFAETPYTYAIEQVQPVGRVVGEFTKFLVRDGNASFDQMYLIGHSLGAHISGIAGNHIAPEKFNTIFALDPARPGFEFVALHRKIDPTDAKYVESIQTDAYLIGAGMMDPAGRASFYPNYLHPVQPGCETIACSHLRSIDYFAESINTQMGFYAKPCYACDDNFVVMGGEPSTYKSGVFFLPTKSKSPFAVGRWRSML